MCVVAKAIVVSVNHRLLPSGLENENLDRPCRGKAPAGPAPQDTRYPQNRRLRLRLQHQPPNIKEKIQWVPVSRPEVRLAGRIEDRDRSVTIELDFEDPIWRIKGSFRALGHHWGNKRREGFLRHREGESAESDCRQQHFETRPASGAGSQTEKVLSVI
jgi:hypothetical protein